MSTAGDGGTLRKVPSETSDFSDLTEQPKRESDGVRQMIKVPSGLSDISELDQSKKESGTYEAPSVPEGISVSPPYEPSDPAGNLLITVKVMLAVGVETAHPLVAEVRSPSKEAIFTTRPAPASNGKFFWFQESDECALEHRKSYLELILRDEGGTQKWVGYQAVQHGQSKEESGWVDLAPRGRAHLRWLMETTVQNRSRAMLERHMKAGAMLPKPSVLSVKVLRGSGLLAEASDEVWVTVSFPGCRERSGVANGPSPAWDVVIHTDVVRKYENIRFEVWKKAGPSDAFIGSATHLVGTSEGRNVEAVLDLYPRTPSEAAALYTGEVASLGSIVVSWDLTEGRAADLNPSMVEEEKKAKAEEEERVKKEREEKVKEEKVKEEKAKEEKAKEEKAKEEKAKEEKVKEEKAKEEKAKEERKAAEEEEHRKGAEAPVVVQLVKEQGTKETKEVRGPSGAAAEPATGPPEGVLQFEVVQATGTKLKEQAAGNTKLSVSVGSTGSLQSPAIPVPRPGIAFFGFSGQLSTSGELSVPVKIWSGETVVSLVSLPLTTPPTWDTEGEWVHGDGCSVLVRHRVVPQAVLDDEAKSAEEVLNLQHTLLISIPRADISTRPLDHHASYWLEMSSKEEGHDVPLTSAVVKGTNTPTFLWHPEISTRRRFLPIEIRIFENSYCLGTATLVADSRAGKHEVTAAFKPCVANPMLNASLMSLQCWGEGDGRIGNVTVMWEAVSSEALMKKREREGVLQAEPLSHPATLHLTVVGAEGLAPKNVDGRSSNPVVQVLKVVESPMHHTIELLQRSEPQESLSPVWNLPVRIPLTSRLTKLMVEVVNDGLLQFRRTDDDESPFIGCLPLEVEADPAVYNKEFTINTALQPRRLADGTWNFVDLQLLNKFGSLGAIHLRYTITEEGLTSNAVAAPGGALSTALRRLAFRILKAEGVTSGDFLATTKTCIKVQQCAEGVLFPDPFSLQQPVTQGAQPSTLSTLITPFKHARGSPEWEGCEGWFNVTGCSSASLLLTVVDRCERKHSVEDVFVGMSRLFIPLTEGDRVEEVWVELEGRGPEDLPRAKYTGRGLGRVLVQHFPFQVPTAAMVVVPRQWVLNPAPVRPYVKYYLGDVPPRWLFDPPQLWNDGESEPLPPDRKVVDGYSNTNITELRGPATRDTALYLTVWDGRTYFGESCIRNVHGVPEGEASTFLSLALPSTDAMAQTLAPHPSAEMPNGKVESLISVHWKWVSTPPEHAGTVRAVHSAPAACKPSSGAQEAVLCESKPVIGPCTRVAFSCDSCSVDTLQLRASVWRGGNMLDSATATARRHEETVFPNSFLSATQPGDVIKVHSVGPPGDAVSGCSLTVDVNPTPLQGSFVRLTVAEGRDLAVSEEPNVYATIVIGSGSAVMRTYTKVVSDSPDPAWNCSVQLPVNCDAERVLIQVWDTRPREQYCIGEATIVVGGPSGRGGAGWVMLQPRKSASHGGLQGLDRVTEHGRLGAVFVTWSLSVPEVQQTRAVPASDDQLPVMNLTYILQVQAGKPSDVRHVCGATATRLVGECSDRVIVVGGADELGMFIDTIGMLDVRLQRWSQLPKAPSPLLRVGHSAVLHCGRIVVFGGYGPAGLHPSLTCIRRNRNKKTDMQEIARPITPRPPSSVHRGLRRAYNAIQDGYHLTTLAYDPLVNEWEELPTSGSSQDYRAGHSAVLFKNKMIVWGGWEILVKEVTKRDARGETQATYQTLERRRNDMVCLDLSTLKWKTVRQNGTVPRERSGHTAVKHLMAMWVFGGCTERSELDAVQALPPESCLLSDANEDSGSEDDLIELCKDVPGVAPVSPRRQCTSGAKRITYSASAEVFFNDLHVYDLHSKTWYKVDTRGVPPAPREDHTASVVASSELECTMMIVFGGRNEQGPLHSCYQFVFDGDPITHPDGNSCVASGLWRRIELSGCSNPTPRYGHVAVLLQRSKKKRAAADARSEGGETDRPEAKARKLPATEVPALQLLVHGGRGPERVKEQIDDPGSLIDREEGVGYKVPQGGGMLGTSILNFQKKTDGVSTIPQRIRNLGLARRHNADKGSTVKTKKAVPKSRDEIKAITERLTRVRKTNVVVEWEKTQKQQAKRRIRGKATDETPGRLTGSQQMMVVERLYYNPVKHAKLKEQCRAAEEQVRLSEGRRKHDRISMERSIHNLFYKAAERREMAVAARPDTAPTKKLTMAEEEELADRLYYRDAEAWADRSRVLDQKFQQDSVARHRYLTQQEWRTTVDRLHRGLGAAGSHAESVSWGADKQAPHEQKQGEAT